MKKQEELFREIGELIKATKEQNLRWSVEVMTTEGNPPEEKPVETEDGIRWTVDECYISYYCNYKGKDFCMITYEMIKTAGERVTTTNMVFLPPLAIRVFDLRALLPYSIPASGVLLNQIHNLFVLLSDLHKADRGSIYFEVKQGTLQIEDEE